MADRRISDAANVFPHATDRIPIARIGSSSAYSINVRDLRSNVLDVHDFGAVGDGIADDSAAINLAMAEATFIGWGSTRKGRLLVKLHPGKVYRIEHPINVCDMEGVCIDGGSPNMGAVLVGQCPGLSMMEIIGSQGITIRNLQLYGHPVDSPDVGTWTARSTEPNGSNSSGINFEAVTYTGYFNKACHYNIGSETNIFEKVWTYLYGNTGLAGLIYVSTLNDFAMTPEHTGLAATVYGNWDMVFRDCGLTSGVGYTCVHIRDFCSVSLYNSYLYSVTHPSVFVNGGGSLRMHEAGLEGTPDCSIEIADGSYHNFALDLHNVGLGSPNNYSIYAADNTILTKSRLTGEISPGLSGGVFKPMRFWRAEGCNFTGLHSNDSRPFELNFDKGYAYECKFNLSNSDSLTFTNGAYSVDCTVEDFSTPFSAFFQVPAGGVKFDADNRLVAVKKATAAWTPGAIVNGASATAYVAVTGVTGDATWVSMASLTGLDEIGWDLSSYAVAGGIYVTLTNRSGGDITVPAGTLFVVAMKVV